MSAPISDHDLIAALRPSPDARTYKVCVTGRMRECATYTVAAPNADLARRIGREYATRLDRNTFRYTTHPRVAYVTRNPR